MEDVSQLRLWYSAHNPIQLAQRVQDSVVTPQGYCKNPVSGQSQESLSRHLRQHKRKLFIVHKGYSGTRHFVDFSWGLYCINTKNTAVTTVINVYDYSNNSVSSYIYGALLKTLDDNESSYTCRSYMKTQMARKIQHIIGVPSPKNYKHHIANN